MVFLRKAALFIISFVNALCADSQSLNYRQGELIVWLKKEVSIQKFLSNALSSRSNSNNQISSQCLNKSWNVYRINFDFNTFSEEVLISSWKKNPKVLMVQKNHLIQQRKEPNDTYFFRQWQHLNNGSQGGIQNADFRSTQAWETTTGGLTEDGDSIVVCVIDGGLEYSHGDLKTNIWYNKAEIPNNGKDDDLNGYIDDYRGWNSFLNNDSVIVNNHGTEVCGIIGAIGNNRVGVAGINWNVKIMMVQGGSDEANAIISYSYPWKLRKDYNLSNGKMGAYIVATNSSWGRDFGKPSESPIWCAMYDSLGSVGILNCGSTSNLDINVDEEGDLPTNCESDYLIGVTNINWDDKKEKRAGYGPKSVDIGAYGESIFTTTSGNTFAYFNGTSAACPQVAAAIALLYSAPCNQLVTISKFNPAKAALLAKDIILNNSRKLKSLSGLVKTEGVLNLYEMINGAIPIEAITTENKITFQNLEITTTPYVLQYRKEGDSSWQEIIINPNQKFELNNLPKCSSYEFRIMGICERFKNTFSNIQKIQTKGCCIPPENIQIIEIGTDNIIVSFLDIERNSNFSYVIHETGSNRYDTVQIVNNIDPVYSINGLSRCSRYELFLYNYCDGKFSEPSDLINFKTSGCEQCDDVDYCKRDRPSAEFEWLESISINDNIFTSGNNQGYGDFVGSSNTWVLLKSATQKISIEPGYSLDSSLVFMAVWIDFNHNSVFEDSENIIPDQYRSKERSEFNFSIPTSSYLGITRMRALVKYGENGIPPPTACFNGIEFGEYEDYCVRIVEQTCPEIISITEAKKTTNSIIYNLVKTNQSDVLTYKYRKLPYGAWSEGRIFNSNLAISNLDSCSIYELRIINDCDINYSNEKIIHFNTLGSTCFVNTKNLFEENDVLIPNPFYDELKVICNHCDYVTINLMDLNGRIFIHSDHINSIQALNTNQLPCGLYFLELIHKNGDKKIYKLLHY